MLEKKNVTAHTSGSAMVNYTATTDHEVTEEEAWAYLKTKGFSSRYNVILSFRSEKTGEHQWTTTWTRGDMDFY